MNVIEVKDISFSYDEHVEAIKHVSFNIQKGSYVTIVGHTGSGKSTLATEPSRSSEPSWSL